jgi:hypothetical protein
VLNCDRFLEILLPEFMAVAPTTEVESIICKKKVHA